MHKTSTLDQSIDRILRDVGIQKRASASTVPVDASASTPLKKVAETLRSSGIEPLSYEEFYAVKNGTFPLGPPPPAVPKLASSSVASGLQKVAHALRIAHYHDRLKRAHDAQNVLKAAEGLILLQPRQ